MPSHIGFDSPLAGVRVVDMSRLLPGPFATMLLADMGADVIKIEAPPGGDYARYYPPLTQGVGALFAAVNRGKRSCVIDLKRDGGAAILLELVANADVVVDSFRPGVADRLGVGFEACVARRPDVIYCAITGYGVDGPLADRAGHDLNYLALSGLLEQTGEPDRPPVTPGFQLADIAGGALYAVSAVTTALFQRERASGTRPAFLDISMTEGALSLHGPAQTMAFAGTSPERGRSLLSGGVPCYRVYTCADGRHLAVAALEPKFWIAFVTAIELPELAHRGLDTGASGDEVVALVQVRLGTRELERWVTHLDGVDCCVEPILSPDDVGNAALHRERDSLCEVGGERRVGSPLAGGAVIRRAARAPGLGAHTRQVLEEAGLDEQRIAQALDQGVAVSSAP